MKADPVAGEQAPLGPGSDSMADTRNKDDSIDSTQLKTQNIMHACKWRNIESLKGLAGTKGGFLTDALRRKAWPLLLGLTDIESAEDAVAAGEGDGDSWRCLPRHRDEEQVALDVNRAFIYYPTDQNETELETKKKELSDLIVEVLRRYPYLCYFQGYHDICQVFMLVLESPWRARLVSRLSVLRIRDFMLTSLEPTVTQLRLIPEILQLADPKLKRHLAGTEPFYALAGTLTMYAHDVQTYGDIARLFDILLVHEPVFNVYMFAQIVLNRRYELFDNDDNDPSMLHLILSKLPQKMDIELLIAEATSLYERYPPESLSAWHKISNASALKTARSVEVCAKQTMDEGYVYFQKQMAELKALERQQKLMNMLWVYRKGAGAAGLAVVVGLVAVYLGRRNASPLSTLAGFYRKWTNGTNWTHTY